MIMMAPGHYTNALSEFTRFIAQNHVAASIGHVHGHPALVIIPHTDGCGSNPAWVELDRRGIDINVYSSSYPTDTLLAVAASLGQRNPWRPAFTRSAPGSGSAAAPQGARAWVPGTSPEPLNGRAPAPTPAASGSS